MRYDPPGRTWRCVTIDTVHIPYFQYYVVDLFFLIILYIHSW